MKRALLLLAILALAGCGTHKTFPRAKWQNPRNWEDLRPGMNVAQVRARVGEPVLMGEFGSGYENWYYPDPQGGVVQIDVNRRVVAVRTPVSYE